MNRTLFLQQLLDQRTNPTYLEIGVFGGRNFLKIRGAQKFAVDPVLGMSRWKRLKAIFKNGANLGNHYYEMTSDRFFADKADVLPAQGLDVVFIDGLHTYEQALRDTNHSLAHLKPDGVIVLHDCNPPHAAAATPANSVSEARARQIPGWDNQWCGDVWKVIVHLRSQHAEVTALVVDCDMGLGVVRRATHSPLLTIGEEELARAEYGDLDRNRAGWLGLRPESFATKIC